MGIEHDLGTKDSDEKYRHLIAASMRIRRRGRTTGLLGPDAMIMRKQQQDTSEDELKQYGQEVYKIVNDLDAVMNVGDQILIPPLKGSGQRLTGQFIEKNKQGIIVVKRQSILFALYQRVRRSLR